MIFGNAIVGSVVCLYQPVNVRFDLKSNVVALMDFWVSKIHGVIEMQHAHSSCDLWLDRSFDVRKYSRKHLPI